MILTMWLYRFKPGMTGKTLDELRARGAERVYPGCDHKGGTFLGRCWGHPKFTHGSLFRREGLAAMVPEIEDIDNLLENLRILAPAVGALEVRNLVPGRDEELVSLGDDVWHQRAVKPWIEAAQANDEVARHLHRIGMSCLNYDTVPPYMIQAIWRERFGYPQHWIGGANPANQASAPQVSAIS